MSEQEDNKIGFLSKYKKQIMALAIIAWIVFAAALYMDESFAGEHESTGPISAKVLLEQQPEFAENYQNYTPLETELTAVAEIADNVSIDVYFGSWCHDSQREVPRFLKAFVDSSAKIRLIALDTKKSDANGEAKAANIKFTPTFVVIKDGQEIGRVVEKPKTTNGEDILAIFAQAK
ncbi:thioredoxin family protein [Thalassotalea sp. Y01]|uniref:thioredoxin family protein n=1 Tax=Thalassotalea sp. Y01 TaxID=2729613 RepID=UPI00145E8CBA|nr:thioredoxin family protein [Thalassotalea sp. Y01]NMP17301.1 thioredoxin family protein [Thalassotalea sp. Y01]